MSLSSSRLGLDDVEVSGSAVEASLAVVQRLSRDLEDLEQQRATAIRLAKATGASLRDIAQIAGVSPQTVSNICKG